MITNPKIRKRRIDKLFSRSGNGTPNTGTLELLPPSLQELAAYVLPELEAGEEILAFSYRDNTSWSALTSSRLAGSSPGSSFVLTWDNVKSVSLAQADVDRIAAGQISARDVEELVVKDTYDKPYQLRLLAGDDLLLIWSAISALASGPAESFEISPGVTWQGGY